MLKCSTAHIFGVCKDLLWLRVKLFIILLLGFLDASECKILDVIS